MNFALTKHWFTEIKEGRKTIEFRVKTAYWTTRLHKLNTGDEITFSLGYSKTRISATVTNIQYFSAQRLSKEYPSVFKFFKDDASMTQSFWGISFTTKTGA